jgi:hypothetical protein
MVSDSADALPIYGIALSAVGFDVAIALSSDEAWARASALRPNIIVIEGPARNGYGSDLLDRLTEDPRTRDLPVVAIGDPATQPVSGPAGSAVFAKSESAYALAIRLQRLINGRYPPSR